MSRVVQVGDMVEWSSRGRRKYGEVVSIVSAGDLLRNHVAELREERGAFDMGNFRANDEAAFDGPLVYVDRPGGKNKLYFVKPSSLVIVEPVDGRLSSILEAASSSHILGIDIEQYEDGLTSVNLIFDSRSS